MRGKWLCGIGCVMALTAAASPPPSLSNSDTHRVVTEVARDLLQTYPLPDVSNTWARVLMARDKAGAYNKLNARELASAIHHDLQTTHRDLHLAVFYEPDNYDQMTQRHRSHRDDDSSKRQNARVESPSSGLHAIAETDFDPDTSTLYIRNEGGWKPDEATFGAITNAMAQGTSDGRMARNVIIDMRNCPGGDGAIGRFMAGYFFPTGDSQFYLDGFFRDGHRVQEWTPDKVPGQTLPDAKLYVIIGKHTASACEGFAYAMQQLKRGTLVGDTSAGAGIAVSSHPILDGIVLHLPFKMIVGPHTNIGWEGTGITPDVPANGRDPKQVAMDLIRGVTTPAPASDPAQGLTGAT